MDEMLREAITICVWLIGICAANAAGYIIAMVGSRDEEIVAVVGTLMFFANAVLAIAFGVKMYYLLEALSGV